MSETVSATCQYTLDEIDEGMEAREPVFEQYMRIDGKKVYFK